MGQEGPINADENVIDRTEEARLYARDESGDYVPVSLTPGGQVETAAVSEDGNRITDSLEGVGEDENRVRIYVEDGDGGIVPLATSPLDESADATTVAQVQYIARALNSQGLDEFVSRVTDSSGTQIDPLTTAVTASEGADEVRVSSPNPLDVSAAEVDVDLNSQTLAQLSADIEQIGGQAQSAVDVANKAEQLADALQSAFAADDQLRVDLQNNNAGTLPVEQQTPVGVEDSAGTQIDPLAQRDLPAGVDVKAGVVERIQNDAEYATSHRAAGVADTNEAFTLVLQNPGGSGEGFLVAADFTTGGAAYLDYSQDITIDAAGTSLTYLPENVMSGTTPALNAEVDGTYTVNGGTLETTLPGNTVAGGAAPRAGGKTSLRVALLNPGESVLYTLTNQSGGEADFSVDVAVSRL